MLKKSKARRVKKSKPMKARKVKPAKAAARPKAAAGRKRISWVDPRSQTPLIESYARQLESFIETMADGRVDGAEIKAQEKRLVGLMKEIEPGLDERQHEKVTQLLCELTAYDIMNMLYTFQESRPKTAFQG